MEAKLKTQGETHGAADQEISLLPDRTEREKCMLTVIRDTLHMYEIRRSHVKILTSKPGVPGAPYRHSIQRKCILFVLQQTL